MTKSVFLVKRTWGSDEKPPPGSKTSIETIEPKSTVAIALAPPPPPPLSNITGGVWKYSPAFDILTALTIPNSSTSATPVAPCPPPPDTMILISPFS